MTELQWLNNSMAMRTKRHSVSFMSSPEWERLQSSLTGCSLLTSLPPLYQEARRTASLYAYMGHSMGAFLTENGVAEEISEKWRRYLDLLNFFTTD